MTDLPPLFAAGQRLGPYELLRRLAVGGMAEVYLAHAVGPGDFRKLVAIKRLLPQHALDPQMLRMFLDEARLMARLCHPNIPQVSAVDDGGSGGAVPYFVMEYVHGTDLRAVLNAAGGPLPLEHALEIASGVAAGLHHAHEHRGSGGQRLEIVHRDVSPSNVLVNFDGGVKLTDFGVAKWSEQKSFTHQGQLKGKFAHMSPEQCRGEALDRRSDVFALGTLLYEMTTGQPAFEAPSEYELLKQIVSCEAPRPRGVAGTTYPAALEEIVMKSLRRDRNHRYATTQLLQLDLEAFAREHRLVVSSLALAGYLETLFGAPVTEWRQTVASGRIMAASREAAPGAPGAPGARGDRPAARAGGAASRTLTDAFAGIPTRAEELATAPALGSKRAVGFAGVFAVGLALLLATTELTSRWHPLIPPSVQGRVNQSSRPAVGSPLESLARSPLPPSPEPTSPGLSPSSSSSSFLGAGISPGRPPLTGLARAGGTSARRRREMAMRSGRVDPGATSGEALIADHVAGKGAADPTDPANDGSLSPGSPGPSRIASPSATTSADRGVDPPTPTSPVRVWDPDSPLPPK